ncbi:MAG: MFS transporter [Xenococcus sp. MO_188.B8]|nr:MFS transporter [Xenococcus sp. MO_188.B8]
MQNQIKFEAVEQVSLIPQERQSPQEFNLGQLWNMNLGFLGIQFGWGLQMVNMSAIFEHLGANAHQIPILWLAAPLTGLLVQPIIGNLSDQTWTILGRRRPYFLAGAIMAALALVMMPNCSSIWVAAGLLWILDSSANVSMVPFRALIGDLLPEVQRTKGFAMQSLMVGLGSVSASVLPWILNHIFHVSNSVDAIQQIPTTVKYSFYLGALVYLVTIIWTAVTTPEKPPENLDSLSTDQGKVINSIGETWNILVNMPSTMRQLNRVQFFTWSGIFCFLLYFPTTVAHNIFGVTNQNSFLYNEAIEWAGLCFAVMNLVCIVISVLLPHLVQRTSSQLTHGCCLLCGGLSLIMVAGIDNQYLLLVAMVGMGITWATVHTMPYAMLTVTIPQQRQGIYQGIFNFFIVLPEIVIALGFGWVMKYLLQDNRLWAVVLGGVFLIIAAGLTQLVQMSPNTSTIELDPITSK